MTGRREPAGQSLLEAVIAMPLLLALLAGGYWGFRRLSLEGAAMSAAQAQYLRAGRGQAGIVPNLAGTVLPDGKGVTVSAHNESLARRVPPFTGLSGSTVSSIEVSRRKEDVGGFLDLPEHGFRIRKEGAVDCWGSGSRSGRNIKRTVSGVVAAGVLR